MNWSMSMDFISYFEGASSGLGYFASSFLVGFEVLDDFGEVGMGLQFSGC